MYIISCVYIYINIFTYIDIYIYIYILPLPMHLYLMLFPAASFGNLPKNIEACNLESHGQLLLLGFW